MTSLLIAELDLEFFGELASYLGLFEKFTKRENDWKFNVLGIELDFNTMEARASEDSGETMFTQPELRGVIVANTSIGRMSMRYYLLLQCGGVDGGG